MASSSIEQYQAAWSGRTAVNVHRAGRAMQDAQSAADEALQLRAFYRNGYQHGYQDSQTRLHRSRVPEGAARGAR
ncbi:MAG TPA: hypothetical protein VNE00_01105, partial [Paraburkholderia sp.]|nr:hypothetical protein [Paraburkholderia sp.]